MAVLQHRLQDQPSLVNDLIRVAGECEDDELGEEDDPPEDNGDAEPDADLEDDCRRAPLPPIRSHDPEGRPGHWLAVA